MKPFKINRNSWHYKLNCHFLQDYTIYTMSYWESTHSDFCSYWQATVSRIIVMAFFTALALLLLGLLGAAVYMDPIGALVGFSAAVGVIGTAIGIAAYIVNREKKEPSQSLIAQKYRAHKEKICPMVEFE